MDFIKRLLAQEAPLAVFKNRVSAPAKHATPTLSPLRFTPLHPAHPGRIHDDGARQVSWLAGSAPSFVFPRLRTSVTRERKLTGDSCGGSRGSPAFPRPCTCAAYGPLCSCRQVPTAAWLVPLTPQSHLR